MPAQTPHAPTTKHQALSTNHLVVHTDGGSRGNPGPAATGIVIHDQSGRKIAGFGQTIGVATNNVAEYTAVLHALNWLISTKLSNYQTTQLTFKLDSKLVVEQLSGRWKIKDSTLASLAEKIKSLITNHYPLTTFFYVPRSQNTAADHQVNLALDAALNK